MSSLWFLIGLLTGLGLGSTYGRLRERKQWAALLNAFAIRANARSLESVRSDISRLLQTAIKISESGWRGL